MFKQDLFESDLAVSEASSADAAGQAVLGKIKGQFFVPNGVSRNKRYYPKSLWEKQLSKPELKRRISEKRMFGTISHDQPLDDKALLDGKVSHIITSLWIDDAGRGMGEAIILNTDAGRVLNTVLRAGGKLFVSSRATGGFDGEKNGVPVVDEDNYSLSTFDVVMDPGFLEANPSLAESLTKLFHSFETKNEGGEHMDMVTEKLIRDNESQAKDITALSEAQKSLDAQVKVLEAEKAKLLADLAKSETVVAQLATYKELGSAEEIEQAFELSKTKMAAFETENTALKAQVESFKDIGSVDEMKQVIEVAEAQKAALAAYEALGTVEEIEKVITFAETIMDSRDSEKKAKEIEDLATELGVDKKVIESVHGKMPSDEIKTFVAGIKNVATWQDPDKKPAEVPTAKKGEGRARSIIEGFRKPLPAKTKDAK